MMSGAEVDQRCWNPQNYSGLEEEVNATRQRVDGYGF